MTPDYLIGLTQGIALGFTLAAVIGASLRPLVAGWNLVSRRGR